MNILIVNDKTGSSTLYDHKMLKRDAQASTKGYGKLTGYFITVRDGAPCGSTVYLTSTYLQKNGLQGQVNTAI